MVHNFPVDRLRIYLAGPDVFMPNVMEISNQKKELCESYGFHGVFPLDAEVTLDSMTSRDSGLVISRANETLIESCHVVIANMTPFRGPSADVGTAYEMGYARSLGLPVYAYTNTVVNFLERTKGFLNGNVSVREDGSLEDSDSMSIEGFGLEDNLMLVGAVEHSTGSGIITVEVSGDHIYSDISGFKSCLEKIHKHLLLNNITIISDIPMGSDYNIS